MNHFELFGLPISPRVDKSTLAKTYFTLQKKYHPDYFGQASETEKEEMLMLSSQVNQAFKILGNRDLTIKYLLQLKGVLEEEEKYNLPPDFLMEVMDLNELKMDGTDEETMRKRVEGLQQEIDETVAPIIDGYDDAKATTDTWKQLKDWYYKKKYLDRLLAE